MALICRQIVDEIEETVWEPVERWVEKREKKCKKRKCKKWCLCCNKWFCWIETFLEKVVTWVAKQVVNLVTRVVCEMVHDVVGTVIATVIKLVEIVVDVLDVLWQLVTLDWEGLKDALQELVADLVDLGPLIVRWLHIAVAVLTFGAPYVLGYLRERFDEYRLKNYIREQLEERFGDDPDCLERIKTAIHLDHGPFGLEFQARSVRTFVDSRSGPDGGPPTLYTLHQSGDIDLYEFSGVAVGPILDRPRVDAHLVEDEVPLDAEDIDDYLASGGAGPHFRVYAFDTGAETEKINVSRDKGRQLGIKFQWSRDVQEVRGLDQVDVNKNRLSAFLMDPMGRAADGRDVCTLLAAGVFTLTDPSDGRHPFGWTTWFTPASPVSGLIHRDRRPAGFMKYVLIHECGHYFSLEHDGHDGLDKIMYSPVENGWWSWNLILEFLVWSGEPRFTLDDGKDAWDFLIEEIPQCLAEGCGARSSDPGPIL
ncbi:MAG: hypothetical protein R3E98_20795 [Gemmatimonadota bacterium]|nr:hypothetical protein [Gemmatimonadota bacterium]